MKTLVLTGLIMIVTLVGGCCTPTAQVPVSSCPVPPIMIMPELAVDRLPQKPPTADALKALAEDHIVLKYTLEQCIISLDGYRQ
jgi:hypothetical protein